MRVWTAKVGLPGLAVTTVKRSIGRYEPASAALPLPTAPENWLLATRHGGANLILLSDGVPIWGGMVTQRPRSSGDVLPLSLATIESYLDRRYVGDVTYAGVGQNDIVADLIARYVALADGSEAGKLWLDVTSIKSAPVDAMLCSHAEVAGLHPMTAPPKAPTLKGRVMVVCEARIGRWRYDPATDKQDWSRQLFLINGIHSPRGGDPGDVKHMLPDGGKELWGLLKHHAQDRARYSFEFRVRTPQGDERILKMHATNEFDEGGELKSRFGVVIDVTEHHQRQDALDKERTRAMRLAAEAQYLAHTDPLTGLANRRRTITQLDKFIARCEVEDRKLALIAFDIDHFKQVNDTHGHQTGDDVLVRVADIARGEVRASDLIGRMGGEEFVWMLPDASLDETANAAERLRRAIENDSGKGGLPTVTASIGYALWQPGDDAGGLLARADVALYEAKGAGRNQVQKAA